MYSYSSRCHVVLFLSCERQFYTLNFVQFAVWILNSFETIKSTNKRFLEDFGSTMITIFTRYDSFESQNETDKIVLIFSVLSCWVHGPGRSQFFSYWAKAKGSAVFFFLLWLRVLITESNQRPEVRGSPKFHHTKKLNFVNWRKKVIISMRKSNAKDPYCKQIDAIFFSSNHQYHCLFIWQIEDWKVETCVSPNPNFVAGKLCSGGWNLLESLPRKLAVDM